MRAIFGFFALALLLYVYDIGDIDGLRQGTEGFYLLITREMFETGHILTPRLLGENHWSKPPFHFWLPMPFFTLVKFFGEASFLLFARLAVCLFTFSGVAYIANWNKRHFGRPREETFFYFLACLGILKYARIYMMEMPLAILSTAAILAWYDYYKSGTFKALTLSGFLLGLSCLVKGPVSLVMALGGVGAWTLLQPRKWQKKLRPLLQWLGVGLLTGLPWFVWCWYTYGDEFFSYFFVRENVGKFTTKSYPIRSVIQGLLFYALPFSLLLPHAVLHLKRARKKLPEALVFLLCCFVCFYLLWFFPRQRSHHYAIPALPCFLLIIQNTLLTGPAFLKSVSAKVINSLAGLFAIATLSLLAFAFALLEGMPSLAGNELRALLGTSCVFLGLFLLWKKLTLKKWYMGWMMLFCGLWVFLLPLCTLPILPEAVVQEVGDKSVSVVFRKPFFMEARLGRKVDISLHHQLKENLARAKTGSLFIVPEELFIRQNLEKLAAPVQRWPLWRRKTSAPEVYRALTEGDVSSLKDYMILIKKREIP